MNSAKTKKLTLSAMFAALCCVGTMAIQIPSPMSGYVNMGDCFVLLSGYVLGPFWGAAAAGLGSMMADVLTGYAHYAPGTLVIKGVCALIAGSMYIAGKKSSYWAALGAIAAESFMVLGYFGYACLLLGKGLGAAASIPGNVVQGVFGLIAGIFLLKIAEKCVPAMHKKAV